MEEPEVVAETLRNEGISPSKCEHHRSWGTRRKNAGRCPSIIVLWHRVRVRQSRQGLRQESEQRYTVHQPGRTLEGFECATGCYRDSLDAKCHHEECRRIQKNVIARHECEHAALQLEPQSGGGDQHPTEEEPSGSTIVRLTDEHIDRNYVLIRE